MCFLLPNMQVMRDPNGISRGSGFVSFSIAEGATRAVSMKKMLGTILK